MRGDAWSLGRSFLVGADTTEQTEVVAQKCLHFLADPTSDRVGIIFSGPGALPRLVANGSLDWTFRITTVWHIFYREFSRRPIGARGFGFRKARESTRSSISLPASLTTVNYFPVSA